MVATTDPPFKISLVKLYPVLCNMLFVLLKVGITFGAVQFPVPEPRIHCKLNLTEKVTIRWVPTLAQYIFVL